MATATMNDRRIQSISLGSYGTRDHAEKLARLLDGQTHMNFQIIVAPYCGSFAVSIQSEAVTQEELQNMVNGVLAHELMMRL